MKNAGRADEASDALCCQLFCFSPDCSHRQHSLKRRWWVPAKKRQTHVDSRAHVNCAQCVHNVSFFASVCPWPVRVDQLA